MTEIESSGIMVSICCLTYNHEKFIRDAIEGFLIQKINFPVEIWIHDDASTDKTPEIIKEYAEKHPRLIKTVFQTENQRSQGKRIFSLILSRFCGKYVALCEGDDYWIDPLKLQKQVDFLEANPDFAICFHQSLAKYEDENRESFVTWDSFKDVMTFEDLAQQNYLTTVSTVFRNKLFREFPDWASKILIGDWTLHLLNAQHGKIKFLKDVMSVYRIHKTGVWNSKSPKEQMHHQVEAIELYIKYFKPRGEKAFKTVGGKTLSQLCDSIFEEGSYAEFRKYGKKALVMSKYWTLKEKVDFTARYLLAFFPPLADYYKAAFKNKKEDR